jgi:hypothetical protein
VEAAAARLDIDWPVALDGDLRAFRDYGCQGWPSLFLWGKGGALRWYHLGEGEYAATEEAIRAQLGDGSNGGWPDLVAPLRPGDEPGAEVIAPTAEVFPEVKGEPIELDYAAAAAYAAASGDGSLSVAVDDMAEVDVEVRGPGLYELAPGLHHGEHTLSLRGDGNVEIHSVQFAPGPAP